MNKISRIFQNGNSKTLLHQKAVTSNLNHCHTENEVLSNTLRSAQDEKM